MKSRLLQSLAFPEMNSRINQIYGHESGTFEWIFSTHEAGSPGRKWHNLADWFSSGKGIYWIQGKAGSGKSTLMKFLWENHETQVRLTKNGIYKDALILRYSFWLSGTHRQRSVIGCYRCLLHQLLKNDYRSFRSITEECSDLTAKHFEGDWTTDDLHSTLIVAVTTLAKKVAVCLFVDGLDEIEGRDQYPPFVKFLRQLSAVPQVKICVSSRPENYWCNQFREDPQLRLQDLVAEDIRKYVVTRFEEAGYGGVETDFMFKSTVDSVCTKAEGVFLWVYLAMRSVVQALDGRASWSEVREMIDLMPTEIADLYESMLSKQGAYTARARQEAAVYFKLCLSGVLVVMMDFAHIKLKIDGKDLLDRSYALDDLCSTAVKLHARISHICAGMVVCEEVFKGDDDGFHPSLKLTVRLFHRTVRDFLTDFEVGQSLMKACSLTDDELLQTFVEGRLMYALSTNNSFVPEHLSGCIAYMTLLKNAGTFTFSPAALIQTIETLENRFTCPSTGDIVLSNCAEQCPDHVCVENFSKQPKRNLSTWFPTRPLSATRHCVDVAGLSLGLGFNNYVQNLLSIYIPSSPHKNITLTGSYKDYLLLCAIKGLWQRRSSTVETIMALIEAGGDPFAEIFLPVWQPRRRCAAAELVWVLYSAKQGLLNTQTSYWVSLLSKIIAMSQESLAFLFLGFHIYQLHNGVDYFMEDIGMNKYLASHRLVWLFVQTPIKSQLEQILRHSRLLLEKKSDRPLRLTPSLESETGNSWIYQDKYLSEPNPRLVALTNKETSHFVKKAKAIYEKVGTSYKSGAGKNIFQPKVHEVDSANLHSELQELFESRPASERIGGDTFWKIHGYSVDPSDPRVWRGTLARFKPATKTDEESELIPEEKYRNTLEQEAWSESSDTEFVDAHE